MALVALVFWGAHPAIHSGFHGSGLAVVSGLVVPDDPREPSCASAAESESSRCPAPDGAQHPPCVICLGLSGSLIPTPLLTPLWGGVPAPAPCDAIVVGEQHCPTTAPLVSAPSRGPPMG
jgi:hypothetical protein